MMRGGKEMKSGGKGVAYYYIMNLMYRSIASFHFNISGTLSMKNTTNNYYP